MDKRAVVGVGILVAAALTWAAFDTSAPEEAQPLQARGGPHLFLSGKYGEVWRVDLAGGVVHAKVPELNPGDPPHHLLARGETLLGWGYETYLLDPALKNEPTELVDDSLFFVASAHEDRVWIATEDEDPTTKGLIAAVREITTDGDVTVEDVRPPDGAWPDGAVSAGLLMRPHRDLVVWDPRTDDVVYRFPAPGDLGPTHGDLVAWCEFGCSELRVTDVTTGTESVIAPPPGFWKFRGWDGAFSPDGATIAVPVSAKGGGKRVQLALVDVGRASARVAPDTETDELFNFVAWSDSGRHVFFTGAEGDERTIFVYDTKTSEARVVPAEVGEFYDATAI